LQIVAGGDFPGLEWLGRGEELGLTGHGHGREG
jgi:hypothetical protein